MQKCLGLYGGRITNGVGFSLMEGINCKNPDIPAVMISGYAGDKAKKTVALER